MTSSPTNTVKAFLLIALAVAIAAAGVHVAGLDDPSLPGLGPAGIGVLLMAVAVVVGARAARAGRSTRVPRAVLAVGIVIALVAGFLIHAAAVTAPLFDTPQDVPSVVDSPPPSQYAPAVARGRELVRAAILAQNLPGVSVAVGVGLSGEASGNVGLSGEASGNVGLSAEPSGNVGLSGEASGNVGLSAEPSGNAGSSAEALAKAEKILWAEGFGWRDVDTQTPVTPKTRFNIGTAASAVPAATIARLGLADTGAEPATAWSPEHVGEPEENPPPFTAIRHGIFRPIGLAPSQPIPGDRATFYVPRSDDDPLRGRRLMYMRDLACCDGEMASYSTASDLVRVGLAGHASINGELAGGMVASLLTLHDSGVVVAVLTNITHANTFTLASKIGDAFAQRAR